MLDEHLWAHVLQHLDTLQDPRLPLMSFPAGLATSCRAAWKGEGWHPALRSF